MRLFFAKIFAVSILAAGLVLSFPMAASTHASKARRAGTKSDAQIESTLHVRLAKSKIGKDGFRFHVERGVVTWEGITRIAQHKGSATRMAKSAGAVQVINNIHVSSGATANTASGLKKASVER
ncbi:MAG: BON domain-containing protein [Bryobacteraceae bacterium]